MPVIEFEKSTVYIIRTALYMDFDCYITHTTPCFSSNVKYAHVINFKLMPLSFAISIFQKYG
jgi:hypothetical protein